MLPLTFGRGAPGTRKQQSHWVTVFDSYRENTLGQDLQTPFSCHDLLSFLDSHFQPSLARGKSKPVPSSTTLSGAVKILIEYGQFQWPDFLWTKQNAAHLATFVSNLIRDGRLHSGTWHEKTWIGFVTVSRMIRGYLQYNIDNGTGS